jgi:hypothetical protein
VLTGDARLSDARSPLPGSTNYIQNSTTLQPSSNFNISGNGAVGGNLAVNGTVTAAALSGTLSLVPSGAKPACNQSTRGAIWVNLFGSGVTNDTIEVCLWWSGAFTWRSIGGVE